MIIYHELTIEENIECPCQNTVDSAGFDTCTEAGERIEPTKGSGWNGHYICNDCGQIHHALWV